MATAYILIQTEVGKAQQVARNARSIAGVTEAENVTGPYDVVVRVEAPDVDGLGRLVVSEIQMLTGITRTLTCPGGAPLNQNPHFSQTVTDVDRVSGNTDLDNQARMLRNDIRRLGNQLGETLVRQQGEGLLEMVEAVRAVEKAIRYREETQAVQQLDDLLAGLDLHQAMNLARAFSTYFYLANVAEQVHRVDYLASQGDERLLERTIDRILDSDCDPSIIQEVASRLEWRPVFTAHPTEAARRSLLTKQKALSELLLERNDPRAGPAQHALVDRRTAELIDQMWQTDELRGVKPLPRDEAAAVLYYLNDLFAEVLPDLGDKIHQQFSRLGIGHRDRQPIRFGTWVGGDRDGNPYITPEVTMDVLEWQHRQGLRNLVTAVEKLASELSVSSLIQEISEELVAELEGDKVILPEVWKRFRRLNATEPYRLKLSFIHQRLHNTLTRLQGRVSPCSGRRLCPSPATPGRVACDGILIAGQLR